MYTIPLVLLFASLFMYSVSSNIVISMQNVNGTRLVPLKDNWRDVLDKKGVGHYDALNLLANSLPWIFILFFFIIQIYNIRMKKILGGYLIHALYAEIILMSLNSIMHVVTILPDANPNNEYCLIPYKEKIGTWIFTDFTVNTCGDMIWSGHTAHLVLALFLIYWEIKRNEQLKMFRFSYKIMACLTVFSEINFLVVLRHHYTVDVLLSALIVPLLMTNSYFHKFMNNYICYFCGYDLDDMLSH